MLLSTPEVKGARGRTHAKYVYIVLLYKQSPVHPRQRLHGPRSRRFSELSEQAVELALQRLPVASQRFVRRTGSRREPGSNVRLGHSSNKFSSATKPLLLVSGRTRRENASRKKNAAAKSDEEEGFVRTWMGSQPGLRGIRSSLKSRICSSASRYPLVRRSCFNADSCGATTRQERERHR